ncbi:MAG: UvrD-helicase domain-containing protein [Desulfovibrio sp.]|jgi:uncharacterized protein (TIGR00375 family)|nr:UvrD-helicase domain-containing protein [Desulfovibrio sp.]
MQEYLADLHIHSRFSLATSKKLNLPLLAAWAGLKGLKVIGSGDFTHPKWRDELRENLRFDEASRLYRLKDEGAASRALPGFPASGPGFGEGEGTAHVMLQGELSLIYKRGGKLRKVHVLVYMPDLAAADAFCLRLGQLGNLKSDGRPIIGLDAHDVLEMVLESHPEAFLIPAHIWTPWFSLFGSKSGFDRLEDCFADLAPEIFALETGLSSDPAMNRLWSALDSCRLVSNSDAHSGEKLGREANIFAGEISYPGILRALKTPEKEGGTFFRGTLEFFPEEGKYHMDGHRACGVRLSPEESRQCGGLCPVCGKALNIGVLNRVLELADRTSPLYPSLALSSAPNFCSLVPLPEILSEITGSPAKSRGVDLLYADLLGRFGTELHILRCAPEEDLARFLPPLGEAVRRMRRGEVRLSGGYDGEYGAVHMFDADELKDIRPGGGFGRHKKGAAQTLSLPGAKQQPKAVKENAPCPKDKWVRRGGFLFLDGEDDATDLPLAAGDTLSPASSAAGDAFSQPAPDVAPGRRLDGFSGALAGFLPDPADNAEQERAVTAGPGPVLVAAGPGAGKTHTLIARIRYLLNEGTDPGSILAATFTRRAAAEIDARLTAEFGAAFPLPRTDTLHALGLELWHKSQVAAPVLLNEESAFRVFAEANVGEKAQFLKMAWRSIGLDREKICPPMPEYEEQAVRYRAQKNAWNLADYTDLLEFFLERLAGDLYVAPYDHVLVDEIQDLSLLQLTLVEALVNSKGLAGEGFFGIGDPNQSIYSFRGAYKDSTSFFRRAWPNLELIRLKRNYRSRPGIVQSAAALLRVSAFAGMETDLVPQRREEAMIRLFSAPSAEEEAAWVAGRVGDLIGMGGHSLLDARKEVEASGIKRMESDHSPGDIAVLVRTHALAHVYRKALDARGIPVSEPAAEAFWSDERVSMILRAAGRRIGIAAIGEEERDELPELPTGVFDKGPLGVAAYLDKIPPFDPLFRQSAAFRALARAYEENGGWTGLLTFAALMDELEMVRAKGEKVQILSLHAAKGLEFRSVFMPALEDGILPYAGSMFLRGKAAEKIADSDPEEERRLFYVGMTRARDYLYLSHAGKRLFYGREIRLRPSPFLDSLPRDLLTRSALVTHSTRKETHLTLLPGKKA